MNRARRFQPRHSNLTLDLARRDELRAARRSIPLSSSIVDEAYHEIKEREAFALLQIETRDGARPLCSEPLTTEEMTQLEADDDFREDGEEARRRLEALCKGGRHNGLVPEKKFH